MNEFIAVSGLVVIKQSVKKPNKINKIKKVCAVKVGMVLKRITKICKQKEICKDLLNGQFVEYNLIHHSINVISKLCMGHVHLGIYAVLGNRIIIGILFFFLFTTRSPKRFIIYNLHLSTHCTTNVQLLPIL